MSLDINSHEINGSKIFRGKINALFERLFELICFLHFVREEMFTLPIPVRCTYCPNTALVLYIYCLCVVNSQNVIPIIVSYYNK